VGLGVVERAQPRLGAAEVPEGVGDPEADQLGPAPLAVQPLDGAAAAAVGTGGQGAALVRPDGQVAARWPAPAPDAGAELRRAVARLLAPAPAGVAGAG
jgi:hypothetical protein